MLRTMASRGWGRSLLAVAPLWLTVSAFGASDVTLQLRILLGLAALVALVDPSEGLVLAAIVAPAGTLLAAAFDRPGFHAAEAMVVASLAGWLSRPRWARSEGPQPPALLRLASWTLGALAVASLAVNIRQFRFYFPDTWRGLSAALPGHYYSMGDPVGLGGTLGLLEGLLLATAVLLLVRQRPVLAVRIPDSLAVSCGLATTAAVLLYFGIGFPDIVERSARIGFRVAAHVGDVNAAGSYFVLMLGLAGGMVARERGARRGWWILAAAAATIGLWLSASRSAQVAAAAVLLPAALWWFTRRLPAGIRYSALAGLLLAVAIAGAVRASRLETDPTYKGAGFRTEFTRTSMRMIESRPWFGIGIGQYPLATPLYLPPQLAWTYGTENAHNYFVQLAAELGVVGFTTAILLVLSLLLLGARAIMRDPDDGRLLGVFAGVVAFLVTCTTGHPLLVPEVAFPFWMSAGLLLVLASPAVMLPSGINWRIVAAMATVTVALASTVPERARGILVPLDHDVDVTGVYSVEQAPDGRYQWASQWSSVFVEGRTKRAAIQVRAPQLQEGATTGIEVAVGRDFVQRFLVRRDWTTLELDIPPAAPPLHVQRINIKADEAVDASVDDQGSRATRRVALQIGEIRPLERAPR